MKIVIIVLIIIIVIVMVGAIACPDFLSLFYRHSTVHQSCENFLQCDSAIDCTLCAVCVSPSSANFLQ